MKIKWLRAALHDLNQISEYIARDDVEAARRTINRIKDASTGLSDQPEMGRRGRVPGSRELIIPSTPYLLIYRIHDRTIEMLRVFPTKQKSVDHF
jgi:addiction module RelE/StbE family toxin